MHFYPAYKLEDVLDLPQNIFAMMIEVMNRMKAEKHLYAMDASAFPNMNQKHMERHRRKLYKQAYPENFKDEPLKTTDLRIF